MARADWKTVRQRHALLDWPYKLHTSAVKGKCKKDGGDESVAPVLLYDVSKDPNETIDLAAQQPDRVAKMKGERAAWKSSALKSLTGKDYGPGDLFDSAPESGKNKKKPKTKLADQ